MIKAPALFATHFHELTALAHGNTDLEPHVKQIVGVANFHVSAHRLFKPQIDNDIQGKWLLGISLFPVFLFFFLCFKLDVLIGDMITQHAYSLNVWYYIYGRFVLKSLVKTWRPTKSMLLDVHSCIIWKYLFSFFFFIFCSRAVMLLFLFSSCILIQFDRLHSLRVSHWHLVVTYLVQAWQMLIRIAGQNSLCKMKTNLVVKLFCTLVPSLMVLYLNFSLYLFLETFTSVPEVWFKKRMSEIPKACPSNKTQESSQGHEGNLSKAFKKKKNYINDLYLRHVCSCRCVYVCVFLLLHMLMIFI